MSREEWYRLALRGLAISFAVVGAIFFIAPDGTVRALNAAGARLGAFAPEPIASLRMWVSLSVAYMVLVTVLAWAAQRDLRRNRHLLAILAAGKATSSLTCLLFYWFSADAFAYLSTFLVDGSIALGVMGIWAAVPSLDRRAEESPAPGRGRTREARALDALLEALVPAGGAFPEGAPTFPLAKDVREFVAEGGGDRAFRLALHLLDLSPFFLPPIWFRRFSRLPLEDRVRLLETCEASRLWPRRQLLHAVKLAALSHFYARPEIQARLGYPHPLQRVPLNGVHAEESR